MNDDEKQAMLEQRKENTLQGLRLLLEKVENDQIRSLGVVGVTTEGFDFTLIHVQPGTSGPEMAGLSKVLHDLVRKAYQA